jgi:hypothetical protein
MLPDTNGKGSVSVTKANLATNNKMIYVNRDIEASQCVL